MKRFKLPRRWGVTVVSTVIAAVVGFTAAQSQNKQPPLDPTKLGEPLPRNLFVELSKLINPTVVSISTAQKIRPRAGGQYRDPMQEFFDDFFRGPGGPYYNQPSPVQALGTGFIIRSDGLIVTNNHVVEGADIIKVQLDNNDSKSYDAKVIGRDRRTDIALLKIDAKRQLPIAPLGTSKDVQVGEWVAAFGNPYGHAHTVTKGIISAIGREIGELNRFPFLQTDASINPGNSGGPLINSQGYVIGVNTAIDARAQGIGFAIPIDNVKGIIAQLESEGRVKRGFIGVGILPLSAEISQSMGLDSTDGVLLTQILEGGPADKAGLLVYDIVTEIGGKKVTTPNELMNLVGDTKIGSKVPVKVIRFVNDKKTDKTVEVVVGEAPDEGTAQRESPKKYFGQKAPFDAGFMVADMTAQLQREWGIPDGTPAGAVVIKVEPGSPAAKSGLHEGDVILHIYKNRVQKASELVRLLQKGPNILRIARRGDILVLPLDTTNR